jgi:hypothetical protein
LRTFERQAKIFLMNRNRTFAQRLVVALVHNFMAVAIVMAVGVAGVATQDHTYQPRPDVEGSSAADFDCQPVADGQFPTAAVIRKVGGATVKVTRPAQVSKAFDVALGERTWAGVNGIELCA